MGKKQNFIAYLILKYTYLDVLERLLLRKNSSINLLNLRDGTGSDKKMSKKMPLFSKILPFLL